jgi:hypothetical protein
MIVGLGLEVGLVTCETPNAPPSAHMERETALPSRSNGFGRGVLVRDPLGMGAGASLARDLLKSLKGLRSKPPQPGEAFRATWMDRPTRGARPLAARRRRLLLVEGLVAKATGAHGLRLSDSSSQVKSGLSRQAPLGA